MSKKTFFDGATSESNLNKPHAVICQKHVINSKKVRESRPKEILEVLKWF